MNFGSTTPTIHAPASVGTGLLPPTQAPVGQGLFTQQAQQLANYQPWHPYATPTPPPAVPAAPTSNSGTNWGEMAGLLGLLGLGANNGALGKTIGGLVKGLGGKLGGLFGGDGGLGTAIADGGLDSAVADSAAANAGAIGSDALASLGGLGGAGAVSGTGALGSGATLGATSGALGSGAGIGAVDGGSLAGAGSSVADTGLLGGGGSGAGGGAGGFGAAEGAGSLGGGLIGAAVPLAIAAYGASTQPYTLTGAYYKRLTDSMTKGQSGNATYDQATPAAMQEYAAKNQLYQMLQQGPTHSDFGAKGQGLPANIMALASQYGMLNPDGTVKAGWTALAPAAPRYSAFGKLLPASTNTYYDPSMLGASGSQAGPGGGAY